jgi:glycosyltransferase involved in cell wall biosynthesis
MVDSTLPAAPPPRKTGGPADTISVVLPVHQSIQSAHFDVALRSITNQTRQTDELVVVEDGPLPRALRERIDSLEVGGVEVTRVRLDENSGAGVANQAGLLAASGAWIAKADADDINQVNRFDTQLHAVTRAGADVCGAWMGEFTSDPREVEGLRVSPVGDDAIARRLRWNSPINHPTAFYRRDLALSVGGYPTMRYMQDYDLFARMWKAGGVFLNLPDVLVFFRADPNMYARRKNLQIHRLEWELQRNLRQYGITSSADRVRNLVLRTGYRLMPEVVTTWAHRVLFRRDGDGSVG